MKAIKILSFTKAGSEQNEKLCQEFQNQGYDCTGYTMKSFQGKLQVIPENLTKWVGEQWGTVSFVFISAAGIAVRCVAPWVKDKFTDSAVVVMDEQGQFVIPLLSGHIGQAVELSRRIAEYCSGTPVITTATDIQGKFAVDVFTKENHLKMTDRRLAKEVSADVVNGKNIGMYSEYEIQGTCPKEVKLCDSLEALSSYAHSVVICQQYRLDKEIPAGALQLTLPDIVVGIGCRKGVPEGQIKEMVRETLETNHLQKEQVCMLASIACKKEEEGLVNLAAKWQVPFVTYTAEELKEIIQVSTRSKFVEETVGVDNVCERAAMLAGKKGTLLQPKTCGKEVTVSLVRKEQVLYFDRKIEHILLFAGTTEGREAAEEIIRQNYPVTLSICTATEYGKECVLQGIESLSQGDTKVRILAGRMNTEEIEDFFKRYQIDIAIDATHPFAKVVTSNIKVASQHQKVAYLRLLRSEGRTVTGVHWVESIAEAVKYLHHVSGNVLITTGSKELSAYTELPDYEKRCYARVLSTQEAVEQTIALGFQGAHLFAMQGPYSKELNVGMLKQVKASYMVTKESGTAGGFEEKLEAAKEAKATLIVIGRPKETGMSKEELYAYLKRRYTC